MGSGSRQEGDALSLGAPILDSHHELLLMDLCQKFDENELLAMERQDGTKVYAKIVNCVGEGISRKVNLLGNTLCGRVH